MKPHKIAVIPGDGIGPEVANEAVKLIEFISQLDSSFTVNLETFPWGSDYYKENGLMMPENGIDTLSQFEAIFLGAVGSKEVPDHITLWGLLLTIRKSFDQYINLRPVKLLKGVTTPLRNATKNDIDMVVVRENSEGEYIGMGDFLFPGKENEMALQTAVFSKKGTERVIRYAFELARQEGKKLTSVSKANALNYSMVYWDKKFEEISKEYPDVSTETVLVDAASMFFVRNPKRFEIVVTSNLFGDILTDLGAAIAGGMGLAAGANLNPERKYPSMFEPIHGSAPDIAGKNLANPIASFWSVSQMMDFLGYPAWAKLIIDAIEQLLSESRVLTPDLGGSATTTQVGEQFKEIVQQIFSDTMKR